MMATQGLSFCQFSVRSLIDEFLNVCYLGLTPTHHFQTFRRRRLFLFVRCSTFEEPAASESLKVLMSKVAEKGGD
jgi:hypothetical protein